jgi:hypothetical protein
MPPSAQNPRLTRHRRRAMTHILLKRKEAAGEGACAPPAMRFAALGEDLGRQFPLYSRGGIE